MLNPLWFWGWSLPRASRIAEIGELVLVAHVDIVLVTMGFMGGDTPARTNTHYKKWRLYTQKLTSEQEVSWAMEEVFWISF